MLKNFWYAVEFSSAITDKPRSLTVMGQSLVVYRKLSDNQVVAMSDWCAHRGTRLSGGWRDGDCTRCPYHGWKYQSDGRCIEIPANPSSAPLPQKARVRAYPAEDRYGWVWLFIGDLPEVDRPPIPTFAHFDDPGMRVVRGEFKWHAHYTHVIENSIDISQSLTCPGFTINRSATSARIGSPLWKSWRGLERLRYDRERNAAGKEVAVEAPGQERRQRSSFQCLVWIPHAQRHAYGSTIAIRDFLRLRRPRAYR